MERQNEKQLSDLDAYGRNDPRGSALVHLGDVAISNAMILYLGSEDNDYLYRPGTGAGLKKFVFKLLTTYNTDRIEKFITSALQRRFGSLVENIQTTVVADFEARAQEIDVFWTSRTTGKTNNLKFNTFIPQNLLPKEIILRNNSQNLISIDFTGRNLVEFVLLKIIEVNPVERLQFDRRKNKWVWGPFILTNLTQDSEEFEEIKELIG